MLLGDLEGRDRLGNCLELFGGQGLLQDVLEINSLLIAPCSLIRQGAEVHVRLRVQMYGLVLGQENDKDEDISGRYD